ncbi:hypothetical protein BH24ACT26_BH24ACT26_16730 [soil metagenome]
MGAVSNQKAYVLPRRGRPRTATPESPTEAPQRRDGSRRRLRTQSSGSRADYVPAAFEGSDATVLVGGETAFNNFFDLIDTYTPLIFVS